MKQKLSIATIVLVLSACNTTSTTSDYPQRKPEPEKVDFHPKDSSYHISGGVLGVKNLSEGASYLHTTDKGVTINQLPDAVTILHPEFSGNDLILDSLKRKNAAISSEVETFLPGNKKGYLLTVKASIPRSSLKSIIHCYPVENPVGQKEPGIIANIYKTALARSKESVLLVPVWRNQTEAGARRLYDIMVSAAYDATKKDSGLLVTMFATSEEEEGFLRDAVSRKAKELKKSAPSAALFGGHTTAAAQQLTRGEASIHQAFGGYNVAGAAANFGGFKAMGVMSGQSHRQEQTTLLLGQQLGPCFYAVGVGLGTELDELSYSAAKAMTFFNVHQNWTLSAGVATVSEKITLPFSRAKSFDRSGVMGEIGAHYTHVFQDFKLMGDVSARVFHSEQTQSAWFAQVSLVNAAVKTSAFVSSIDTGINFSYEY
jgi:hypothetical protein